MGVGVAVEVGEILAVGAIFPHPAAIPITKSSITKPPSAMTADLSCFFTFFLTTGSRGSWGLPGNRARRKASYSRNARPQFIERCHCRAARW